MKQLFNVLFAAAVISLHIATGWAWILYVLATIYVLMSITLTACLLCIRDKVPAKGLSRSEVVASILNCSMYFAYFAFISNWWLLGMLLLSIVLAITVRKLCTK